MKENAFESQKNFQDYITLNQKMSPQEAIEKLGTYHKASPESILEAFMNLRGFNEGTVEFRESVNSGRSCIVMEGLDSNGKFSWNHLINDITGQPQTMTS